MSLYESRVRPPPPSAAFQSLSVPLTNFQSLRRAFPSPSHVVMRALLLILLLCAFSSATASFIQPPPSVLLTNYNRAPLALDTPTPRLSWVNSHISQSSPQLLRGTFQVAFEIEVQTSACGACSGTGCSCVYWASGEVPSLDPWTTLSKPLPSFATGTWRVRVWSNITVQSSTDTSSSNTTLITIGPSSWSDMAPFETGPLFSSDWQHAPWISRHASPPLESCDLFKDSPYPLLRWRPALPDTWDASAARLYVSGLGYFHVFVNGAAAGDAALQPSWSSYNTTVPYVALDISSLLLPSANNTIDIWLGAGWWSVMPNLFWGHIDIRDALAHGVPQARALLHLPSSHSSPPPSSPSTSPLPMLPSATMATGSPVLFSSIHLGETFDCTRDVEEGPWSPAVLPDTIPTGDMQAETIPPIVIQREVPAVSLQLLQPSQCGDSTNPGACWIADFGENMAGVVRLKVRGGTKGQRVTMRFGELLHVDGSLNVNTSNNAWKDLGACSNSTTRPGEQMDILILSGQPEQEWAPLFVYHGFRYLLMRQALHVDLINRLLQIR